jgi:hypothetical protein
VDVIWGTAMKRLSFRKLLLKNTLALALPMLVLLCVLMFIVINFPVIQNIQDVKLDPTENLATKLDEIYKDGRANVVYEACNLQYTGMDYLEDGKLVAAYYYNIDDDGMNVFLIKTEKPEQSIDSVLFKGKLLNNEIMTEYIIKQFEEDTDLYAEMLNGFVNPYIISEPDYPYRFIILVYLIILIPVIAAVMVVSYTILIFISPGIHPQTRQLAEYGDIKEIINELDIELKKRLVFSRKNVYVTENYMIISYIIKTDVIKLDMVKYMSKKQLPDYTVGDGEELVYRLTFSNPEKFFYEVDLVGEELADMVEESVLIKNKP